MEGLIGKKAVTCLEGNCEAAILGTFPLHLCYGDTEVNEQTVGCDMKRNTIKAL